jgi:4-oxalocrotonate tautomerase
MPIVHISMLKGRTVDQKRALVKKVTDAICETVNASADAVSIVIEEMEREHYAKAGVLHLDQKK